MEPESRAGFLWARVTSAPGACVGAAAFAGLVLCASDDVGFGDAAELGSAGFELGVAHPTGFAFDILALRLFSYVPIGHLAFRQNVGVALEAALALGLLAATCAALAQRLGVGDGRAQFAGSVLAGTSLFGFQTFRASATTVEVYSLALLAALLAANGALRGARHTGLVCLVLGFAPGLHVTAGLFALLALLATAVARGAGGTARFVLTRLPVIAAGAAIVAYLPLAARRHPALDWGDPETVSRLVAHLTAARIRSAFQSEMLASDPQVSFGFARELAELWPIIPFALLGFLLGWRRNRLLALAPLAWFALDAAYASFVNPMGVADRQVGHMAGACIALLAGVGVAFGCERMLRGRGRFLPELTFAACALLFALACVRARAVSGYAASELYGSGGPLAALAPRALYLCSSDDACAGALFALDVEAVRPDVAVAPAQHLWEASVLRRIGLPATARFARADVPAGERRALAARVLETVLGPGFARPVRLESSAPLRWAALAAPLVPSADAPYLDLERDRQDVPLSVIERRLERLRSARLPAPNLVSEHARHAWSSTYGALGERTIGTDFAVRMERRAVELAPERAAAFTNLSVALEARGEIEPALASARRALELAPERATAWLNLARLTLVRNGSAAARDILALAKHAGIEDPRLDALERELSGSGAKRAP